MISIKVGFKKGVNLEGILLDVLQSQDLSDIVRLSGIFEDKEIISRKVFTGANHTTIYQTLGDPVGAGAYFLFPHGAAVLDSLSSKFYDPLDIYLSSVWIHKLRFRSVKPFPFEIRSIQNQDKEMNGKIFESSIGDRIKPKQNKIERLKIELYRFKNDIKKIVYLPFNFFK